MGKNNKNTPVTKVATGVTTKTVAPGAIEKPVVTETPAVTETSAIAETPVTTETPAVTETSAIAEKPVVTETLSVTETSAIAETPVTTETPAVTEIPAKVETAVAAITPAVNKSKVIDAEIIPSGRFIAENGDEYEIVMNSFTFQQKTYTKEEALSDHPDVLEHLASIKSFILKKL